MAHNCQPSKFNTPENFQNPLTLTLTDFYPAAFSLYRFPGLSPSPSNYTVSVSQFCPCSLGLIPDVTVPSVQIPCFLMLKIYFKLTNKLSIYTVIVFNRMYNKLYWQFWRIVVCFVFRAWSLLDLLLCLIELYQVTKQYTTIYWISEPPRQLCLNSWYRWDVFTFVFRKLTFTVWE